MLTFLSPTLCTILRPIVAGLSQAFCYAQALGVVDVGSLSVELSGKVRVRSGRPSCRASQGQNHGVWRGCKGSGKSGNQPEDRRIHK